MREGLTMMPTMGASQYNAYTYTQYAKDPYSGYAYTTMINIDYREVAAILYLGVCYEGVGCQLLSIA